ncbi:sensor histidine kinase [Nonomuraea dietziae]|uniref:sensor histidine kinase n=1 Tax=Nonomuraea dietziae TaxID=65515 RepID=UPI0033FE1251
MHLSLPMTIDVRPLRDIPPLDIAVGLALAVMVTFDSLANRYLDNPFLDLVVVIGALLATVPQAFRRWKPGLSVILTASGAVILTTFGTLLMFVRGFGYVSPVVFCSVALTLYTLLRQVARRVAWIIVGTFGLGIATAQRTLLSVADLSGAIFESALLLVAGPAVVIGLGLIADLVRSRTELREARKDGSEHVIAAQREQAAMVERARIAREMHDVVAHSIALVAVQAEAAPYTVPDLSDSSKVEFAEIATAARRTLTEMRRLLGVLRADTTSASETEPQPGLARLGELIEQAGGEIQLDVVGEETPLPRAVDVSAYRIVQECLANARTHAPGSHVSIELAYRPNLLVIRVVNDAARDEVSRTGVPGSRVSAGHGMIGMRERALSLGGWFSAQPTEAGGFLIQAGLPLE